MAFTNMKLTTFGSNIEAKCHQGKGLHFTRIAVGDGLLGNGSMINRTALVSERHSMQIDGIIATENTTQSAVIATLDNSVFTEGFYYREIALFAKDPDTNQEGAYLYDNAGQECEFLGLREDGVVIYERIKMLIRVEQTSQISFDGSGNPLYMSPEDVRGMIEQHNVSEDAHKTKADLGNDGLLKDSQRPKADGLYMPDGKTKISDKIVNIESAMLLALAAASPYSAAAAYAQGAYCTKDGKLYRCTVAIPQAEAWNAAHWTATTMGAELVAIYTTLANKAPGGFGWGEAMKDVLASDAEDTYETYCGKIDVLLADMPDKTSQLIYTRGPSSTGQYYGAGNVVAVLSKILGTSASLIGLSPDPRGTPNGLWRMLKDNGKWQPVEWINPPMTLGTEYRTTERYMGKPVYAKLVNCEALPNAGYKTVSVGVSGLEKVIDVSGCAIDAHNDDFYSIPATNFSSSVHNVGLYVTGSQAIAISTQSDRSSYNAYVKVKYTKTTD